MTINELETDRLLIRQWVDADFSPFADLTADSEVMKYFPSTLDRQQSDDLARKIQSLIKKNGWGFWAVEVKQTQEFIGFVGLNSPKESLPFSPCVEIGWRLHKQAWGKGYATEAASEALRFAFDRLKLDEVVAFTTLNNHPSMAVMKRLGMHDSQKNFFHPELSDDHPLSEHVLYKIAKSKWQSIHSKEH